MKYWDNICDLQAKQTKKGIDTYGQTLEENTSLTITERLTMLEEELIDGLMYIEHIKAIAEEIKQYVTEECRKYAVKCIENAEEYNTTVEYQLWKVLADMKKQ